MSVGSLVVLTNAPAPYTQSFVDAVRAEDVAARIIAARRPRDIGRAWAVDDATTLVTGSALADAKATMRALREARPAHVMLTGGYTSAIDAVRRLLAGVLPHASVHFWGERLRPPSRRSARARRLWFGSPGLDGIFAIGSRAVATYREVTRGSTPIHVLPYTTDAGLDLDHRPHDEPVIGFAGRLLPYKGVDVLLDGLAALPARSRPRLEVAGTGPDEPRLRHLAEHLGLGPSVTWLGHVDQRALAERRRSWWTAVVPSRASEGWGVVVNEALNSGVPVVASAHVHAATDLLREGRNGIVVPMDRVEHRGAWAEAIAASCDPASIDERSAYARTVASAFAPANAARWLVELWSSPAGSGLSFVDHAWRSIDG